jgi:hypothetical protein
MEDDPYSFSVTHQGDGEFVMTLWQDVPPPPEVSVLMGEWFYNLRCALDYAVYATAICDSGTDPPPGERVLQFPCCFTEANWGENLYRLKPLTERHRYLIECNQPYRCEDPDFSALGWLHRLARIDRHRRLHIMGAYTAELDPLIAVPMGCTVDTSVPLERVVVDGDTEIGRFTVTPWESGWKLQVNPRLGLDPEMTDWQSTTGRWSSLDYGQRLNALSVAVEATVAVLEYDCTGYSPKSQFLADSFRIESDTLRKPRKS